MQDPTLKAINGGARVLPQPRCPGGGYILVMLQHACCVCTKHGTAVKKNQLHQVTGPLHSCAMPCACRAWLAAAAAAAAMLGCGVVASDGGGGQGILQA
jgi:hypothetical protein